MRDDLAAMPAGPALAAALGAIELARVPNDRMLDVLAAQYRQLSHEQARTIAPLAEIGRCDAISVAGAVTRVSEPGQYAAEETRAALRWTRNAAECEHDLAEAVVHGMPLVFEAWWAGEIDRPRVRVFERYLTGVSAELVQRICRAAVPLAPRRTTGQLAVLLRRMVIAADPDAAARWYRKGLRERGVTAYPAADGTVTISANGLPADEAEAACVRIEQLADSAKRAGHPGRIGQIRCDLFLGLLDGRYHHMAREQIIAALLAQHGVDTHSDGSVGDDDGNSTVHTETDDGRVPGSHDSGVRAGAGGAASSGDTASCNGGSGDTASSDGSSGGTASYNGGSGQGSPTPRDERRGIEVRVALSTLLGHDNLPAEIPGLGLLVAPAARTRVALQRRAQWRFAVTDTDGHLLTDGITRRRPASMRGADGPTGGIVELHIPVTLLDELITGGHESTGEWAGVIADVARQHADRRRHLRTLDDRPGDRLPSPALRRHTEIRDRTCSHPCCRRPAHRTDSDHTRDHAHGGATIRGNLGPRCPHDHRLKHDGGWQVEQPEPGLFVWRSPLGGEYRTRGEFLHPPMPEPGPADPEPDPPEHCRYVEGPILRPPQPSAPRRAPPPAPSDPDEPPPF